MKTEALAEVLTKAVDSLGFARDEIREAYRLADHVAGIVTLHLCGELATVAHKVEALLRALGKGSQ